MDAAQLPHPLDELDHAAISVFWYEPIARRLNQVWGQTGDLDRTILAPLRTFMDRSAAALAELLNARPHGATIPPGTRDEYPVCTTLLTYQPDTGFAGVNYLLLILVTASLERGPSSMPAEAARLRHLAAIVRHIYESADAPLRLVIGEVKSLPGMVAAVDHQLADDRSRIHKSFASLWRSWLRPTLTRWINSDPARLATALRPVLLVQPIETGDVQVGGTAEALSDNDGQTTVHVDLTAPEPVGAPSLPPVVRIHKAIVSGLVRASSGDLYHSADQIAPDELIADLTQTALRQAEDALSRGDLSDATQCAALALAIATGIRGIDVATVTWGTSPQGHRAALDPDQPILHRIVCRPPNAVVPGPELDGWLEPSLDQIAWPVPTRLYRVLRGLSGDTPPSIGKAIFANTSSWTRTQLWETAKALEAQDAVAPGRIRLALAVKLTERFGPEVAQLVLADTFSSSPGPAYYSAVPAAALAEAVQQIQSRWFGVSAEVVVAPPGFFGSRLIVTEPAVNRWPAALRKTLRIHPTTGKAFTVDRWRAMRNHLAAALCAVTGARPTAWLAELRLDQLVPEYGLVILSDKATDLLRETRVVATGRRWTTALRRFLAELCTVAASSDPVQARHAKGILSSTVPLFALPGDGGQPFTVAEFVATMPEPLRGVPNYYRHRLNQVLQRTDITPELRHAQLGWVVSPASTFADLSPWSPKAFGEALAPVLDEFMVHDGWYPASQRISPWTWERIPARPLADWESIVRAYAVQHADDVRRQKAQLVKRWKDVAGDVCQRLAQAVAEYIPSLTLETATRRLERADWAKSTPPVELTLDHYGLLCDRVSQGDKHPSDATERLAAQILLFRIVLSARRRQVVSGPLPTRPVLSVTSSPSPFLPGLGLAVRHANELRNVLLRHAAKAHAVGEAALTTFGVLAFSASRSLTQAEETVKAAAKLKRSHTHPDRLRFRAPRDGKAMPLIESGIPAILLAQRVLRAPMAHTSSHVQLAAWARRTWATFDTLPGNDEACLRYIEALFQACGRMELSGPERLIMLREATPAMVTVDRVLASEDDWPLNTAKAEQAQADSTAVDTYENVATPDVAPPSRARGESGAMQGYLQLTALLDPERFPRVTGAKSDSHRGWQRKLAAHLSRLQAEYGLHSNVGLLIGFTLHRLRHGGFRKKHLAHVTLGWVTRFGSDLLVAANGEPMLGWSAETFRDNYLTVLWGKPVTARRQSLDAIVPFHHFLVDVHQAPPVDFGELFTFAGERPTAGAPGALTDREVHKVLEVLRGDLDTAVADPATAPEAIRLLTLRLLMFLILEASGVRPSSAYGLKWGDLILLAEGRDFLHLHASGGFGRVKSTTSEGYVPLEGTLWHQNRAWVLEQIDQQRAMAAGGHWWAAPLFGAHVGSARRFARAHLTHRIDELLKWVTGSRTAHTYWLRKRRVTARHRAVYAQPRPMARDSYQALRMSGHATIQTSIESYIGDAAILFGEYLKSSQTTRRADILALTGEGGPALDVAWQRAGGAEGVHRISTVLDRLGVPRTVPREEQITTPPPLAHGATLTPQHIDAYARAMHRYRDRNEALLRSGLSPRQADTLDQLARTYALRRGHSPWSLPGLRGKRTTLPPPRRYAGTDKLFALLQAEPSAEVVMLANALVEQAYLERLHESRVIMELPSVRLVEAARQFMATTGIAATIERDGSCVSLSVGHRQGRKTHEAAVVWILTVIWVYHSLGHPS